MKNLKKILIISLTIYFSSPLFGEEVSEKTLFEKICSLYNQGEMEGTLKELSSLQGKFPRSKYQRSIHFLKGEVFLKTNRYKEALVEYATLEKEIKANKENIFLDVHQNLFLPIQSQFVATLFFRIGEANEYLKQYEEAEKYFQHFLKNYPNDYLVSEAIFHLGKVCEEKGKHEKADEYFSRLIKEYPGYEYSQDYLLTRGLIFYKRENYKEALNYFTRLKDPRGFYFSGLCYEQIGDFQKAIRSFEELIQKYPSSPFSVKGEYHIAEASYLSNNLMPALQRLEEFINKFPDKEISYYASFRTAYIHYLNHEHKTTLDILLNLENKILSPELLTMVYTLEGKCYYDSKEYKRAIDSLQKCIDKLPQDASKEKAGLTAKIIYLYFEQGLFNEGSDIAQKFLSLYPKDALAPEVLFLTAVKDYLNLAYSQAKMKCEELFSKYPHTEPADKSCYFLTLINFKKSDYDAVVTNYPRLLSLADTSSAWTAKICLLAAEAYDRLGFPERSQEVYLKFLKDYPQNEETSLAFRNLLSIYTEHDKEKVALEKSNELMPILQLDKNTVWEVKLSRGDALFNQKEYAKALDEYKFLSQMEIDRSPEEKASILYKQGECLRAMDNYNAAINLWREIPKKYSNAEWSQKSLLKVGETFFNEGEFPSAIEVYKEFIKLYPQTANTQQAIMKLADAYFNIKDYSQAATYYESFIKQYPANAQIEAVKNKYYLSLSQSDADKLLAWYPESPAAAEIYWQKGGEFFKKEDYQAAIKEFDKLKRYTPTHKNAEKASRWAGECYYRLKDYQKAKEAYAYFVDQYPDSDTELKSWALFGLAESEYALKNYTGAEKRYKEVISKFSPLVPAITAQMKLMYLNEDIGRWEEVVKLGEDFIKRYPKNENISEVNRYLSWVYEEKLKQTSRAVNIYKEMLARETSSFEVRYRLANACYTDKNISEAIKILEEAKAMGPVSEPYWVDCYIMLGDLYKEQKKWKEAIDIYQWVIRLSPDSDWIKEKIKIAQTKIYNFAWEFQKDGKYDQAIETYKILEQGEGISPIQARYYIGLAYKDKGDTEMVVNELERMKLISPSSDFVKVWIYGLFALGEIYEAKEEWGKALETYKQITEITSDKAEIKQLQKQALDLVKYLETAVSQEKTKEKSQEEIKEKPQEEIKEKPIEKVEEKVSEETTPMKKSKKKKK